MKQFVRDNLWWVTVAVVALIYLVAVDGFRAGPAGFISFFTGIWLAIKALVTIYGRYARAHLVSWVAGRKLLRYMQLVDAGVMTVEEYDVKAEPLKKLL